MLFYQNLDNIIFTRNQLVRCDELVIISGYVGPTPIHKLSTLPIKTSVIYGMYGCDGIQKSLHHALIVENEALNNAYSKIKSCVSEEKFKSKMAVSKAEQEARIKVLTHREELVEKIFSSVDEKLKEFTESEKYIGFLSDLLKDEITDSNSVVYLREEDLRYESELRKITGNDCSFEADKSIVYGGLSIYDRTTSVLNNKTIDNMLEEQKENFGSNYRLA